MCHCEQQRCCIKAKPSGEKTDYASSLIITSDTGAKAQPVPQVCDLTHDGVPFTRGKQMTYSNFVSKKFFQHMGNDWTGYELTSCSISLTYPQ